MKITIDYQTLPLTEIGVLINHNIAFLKLLIICCSCYFIGCYINKVENERKTMLKKDQAQKRDCPKANITSFSSKEKPHGDTVIKPKIEMQSETVIISLDEK